MLVTCPNCETTFAIPDAAYVPGRKARCSHCKHVFPLPELDAPEPAVTPDDVLPPQEAPTPLPEQKTFKPKTEKPQPVDSVTSDASKKRLKLFLLVMLVLLLVVAGISGFMLYRMLNPATGISGGKQPQAMGANATDKTPQPLRDNEKIKGLGVQVSRQYEETGNKNAGRLTVIEGKVLNHSNKSKDLIIVEVALLDKNGNTLAATQQYCGITLSAFQLQTLNKAALEDSLKNRVEILVNNTGVKPGTEVPFTCIFFSPPPNDKVFEISVNIIDAEDTKDAEAQDTKK